YAAKYGLGYTIAFDATADVFHTYRVYALPTQVLIGPDGRVAQVLNGPLTDQGAAALLEPLLPRASASPNATLSPPSPGASPSRNASPSP
ncbi:MAG TPA: hypothetical protein VIH37_13120, partial [Candidatus Limnocylindrales bacterium]